MQNKIDDFEGEYRFLSNFHPSPVTYEKVQYTTIEHAYQAAKTLDEGERFEIANTTTPGKAKRLGAKCKVRPDWRSINMNLMQYLINQKFVVGSKLAESLLSTGDAELIEGNDWGDTFWGICDGKGENHLGKMLMKRREMLKLLAGK